MALGPLCRGRLARVGVVVEGISIGSCGFTSSVTMKRHLRWIVCLAAVLVAPISFAEESHVRARLVADAAELQGGESFLLGVLLEPDPGWHVYWRNPGEAGLATDIAYDLTEGFEVGELQWPVPVSFDQPDGIVGFG